MKFKSLGWATQQFALISSLGLSCAINLQASITNNLILRNCISLNHSNSAVDFSKCNQSPAAQSATKTLVPGLLPLWQSFFLEDNIRMLCSKKLI